MYAHTRPHPPLTAPEREFVRYQRETDDEVRHTCVVKSIRYERHVGDSGISTLKVQYLTDWREIHEYVPLEHIAARKFAAAWWSARSVKSYPSDVREAVRLAEQGYVDEPYAICVGWDMSIPRSLPRINDVAFRAVEPALLDADKPFAPWILPTTTTTTMTNRRDA